MKLGIDNHGPQRIFPNDFGDALTVIVAPLSGQNVPLAHTIVHEKIFVQN